MQKDKKKQAIVAGIIGIVTAVLTLLATSPKARTAIKDCGAKLKSGDQIETVKGYIISAIDVAEEKLGALKSHLETKPEKTDKA